MWCRGSDSLCGGSVVVQDCTPGAPAAADGNCDGVDDDCDGEVDEDFLSEPTSCDVGSCSASGQTLCVSGQVLDTCIAPVPAELDSTCDGIDNDCDGQTDEDYVSVAGSCGVGACEAEGITACVDGSELVVNCSPGAPASADLTCDGVDDDCDGELDEDYQETETVCATGSCEAAGVLTCQGGEEVEPVPFPAPPRKLDR